MSEALDDTATVEHLVYVAGFCLDVGEAFMPFRLEITDDRAMADATTRSDDRLDSIVRPEVATSVLFADVSADVAHRTVARLEPHAIRTFWEPVTRAPWRSVPSTYVRCTRDLALPPAVQTAMATRCSRVVDLDAGHSPHISVPDLVAAVIEECVRGVAFDPADATE